MRLVSIYAAAIITAASTTSFAAIDRQDIYPSDIDGAVTTSNEPHIVFRKEGGARAPLLVFLPGTGGKTTHTAKTEEAFIDAALAHGYRFVILSYIDTTAVAQVCTPNVLARDPTCAEEMRQKRIFGDDTTRRINDTPQDAIVHRLTMLLRYLVKTDTQGHWEQYLNANEPQWTQIVLAGQSQGGGMAAFIAKRVAVGGLIDFSGGWDMQSDNQIAAWYARPGATPPARLYGTYHVEERFAKVIAASYRAMNFPRGHQFALDKPVLNPEAKNPGHDEGASDPVYKGIWEKMLTSLSSPFESR